MSGLETMHDMLHDPAKRRPLVKRVEMLGIVTLLSASWISAGYIWGHRDATEKAERVGAELVKRAAICEAVVESKKRKNKKVAPDAESE